MAEPVVLIGTERHVLHSDIVDLDFEISIKLPLSPTEQPLPVVFTTDANLSFAFMANLSDLLLLGGDMPQVLTVGIGYPVGSDLGYVFERRAKDLVERTDHEGPSHDGVAPLFLRFIREELWPWLSERFHVSDDRTLRGHSLGGGFALYALFHGEGFFKRFVAGSPDDIDFPSRFASYEQSYAADHDDLNAVVFLGAGDAESHPRFETNASEIGAALTARDYPSLTVKTVIFPDDSHLTAAVVATTHGMRWVFSQSLGWSSGLHSGCSARESPQRRERPEKTRTSQASSPRLRMVAMGRP